MPLGFRRVAKSTGQYMRDVNAREPGAASVSAALVSMDYGRMRDRIFNMPEAGSTLGAETARVLTFCEDQWTGIARVVPQRLPKATAAMKRCTRELSILTAETGRFTKD